MPNEYGVYGENWDKNVAYRDSIGRTTPQYVLGFHENCLTAISSAKQAWTDGLSVVSIGLWTYGNPDVVGYYGRQDLLREWSLVVTSIIEIGWKLHTWSVDMDSGDDHTANALFVREGVAA